MHPIIVSLDPPGTLKGIPYRAKGAAQLLRATICSSTVWEVSVAPFIGIKLIDMLLVFLHLV